MRQFGFVAAGAEPVAHSCGREGRPVRSDKEGGAVFGNVLEGLGQCCGNRNTEMGFGLFPFHLDEAIFDVSPTHTDHVRAALACVERQQHRETRHATR